MSPLHLDNLTAPRAAPSRNMLLLHGIYGAERNWRTVARRLVQARPGLGRHAGRPTRAWMRAWSRSPLTG